MYLISENSPKRSSSGELSFVRITCHPRACGSFRFILPSSSPHPHSYYSALSLFIPSHDSLMGHIRLSSPQPLGDPRRFAVAFGVIESAVMEKPVAPQTPLTILHHDERLVFPGYDAMVGGGHLRHDEEDGRKPWTAGESETRADSPAHGRNKNHRKPYKKHKRKLIIATIIWFAAFPLIPCLHFHHTSIHRASQPSYGFPQPLRFLPFTY